MVVKAVQVTNVKMYLKVAKCLISVAYLSVVLKTLTELSIQFSTEAKLKALMKNMLSLNFH
jgi:hypothetical protein